MQYPSMPGHKVGGTSEQAAVEMSSRASSLRDMVLKVMRESALKCTGWTADEMAEYLHESILSIRPRFSELRAKNLIEDTGYRRKNISGKSAVVWRIPGANYQPGLL